MLGGGTSSDPFSYAAELFSSSTGTALPRNLTCVGFCVTKLVTIDQEW